MTYYITSIKQHNSYFQGLQIKRKKRNMIAQPTIRWRIKCANGLWTEEESRMMMMMMQFIYGAFQNTQGHHTSK